jgi:hypothetical protein
MSDDKFLQIDTVQLDFLALALQGFNPTLRGTENIIESIVAQSNLANFESLGGRTGSIWEELKPRTIKEKQALGYGGKQALERTGALKQSLISPQATISSDGQSAEVKFSGEHSELIAKHQLGDPSTNLPARTLIFFSTPDFNNLTTQISDKIVGEFQIKLSDTFKR